MPGARWFIDARFNYAENLLRRDGGATIAEVAHATGWQPHSVRGAISGTLRKKLRLVVDSENSSRGRIYRIRHHA